MKLLIVFQLFAIVFSARMRGINNQLLFQPQTHHVFSQIKTLLQTGATGPYNDVLDLLENMKTQLIAEQTAQKAVYDEQTVDCNDEMALRNGEMKEATAAELAAKTSFDACTESKRIYTEGQTTLAATLASKKGQITKEEVLRGQQRQLFEHMQTDLVAQIAAINMAITYSKQLAATQSTDQMQGPAPAGMLIQVPQLATTLTLHAISTNTFEGLTPVFLALAEMVSEDAPTDYGVVGAESDAVTQLQTMLNDFLANCETQLRNIREEEAGRVAEFTRVMTLLNTMVQKLTDELVEISGHLMEMERCINTEDSLVTKSKAKFSRNQGIYDATVTMCELFDEEYNAAEEARVSELTLLASLKTMVVSKLAHDRGMAQSALEQEDGFVSYDGARNYGYEAETFEGSEYDENSENYVGNLPEDMA